MLRNYLRLLVRHAINIFSGASLLIAFLAIFLLPLGNVGNAIVLVVAASLSVLAAGYYVWKEVVKQFPEEADLLIDCSSVLFSTSSMSGGIPNSPMKFVIDLDAINRGEEQAILKSLEVTKLIMNNTFFKDKPQKTELVETNTPHGSNHIHFPFTIDGKKRIPNLRYTIFVELLVVDRNEFAERLGEMNSYEIELSYTFEGMDRSSYTRKIPVKGTFDEFKQSRINEWSDNENCYRLAIVALKAMGKTNVNQDSG